MLDILNVAALLFMGVWFAIRLFLDCYYKEASDE